jgi:basic amino acid/polyamine antiporter, APA family
LIKSLAGVETLSTPSEPASGNATSAGAKLRRVLRLHDLVLLIIGTVIGSGIFLVPGVVLKAAGDSLPVALSVWIVGGILSLLGALTYGELSATHPEAGGLYVYIRDCFGRFPAFLFGWILFFVVSTGSIATLAVAFGNYLAEFLPLGYWSAKLVSILMIGIIAAVNVLGTRKSANLQNVATLIKVLAILAMSALLLWSGNRLHGSSAGALPMSLSARLSGIGLGLVSVLWAYEGWQYATFAAGESVNPRRDYPLAFLAGVFALMAVYLLANFGYVAALGVEGVANSNRVAATALATVISPVTVKLVTLVILISIFSAAHSIMLTSPRVYYAMAKDGLFFHRLAEVHPRFATPAFAIAGTAVWASLLAASGTFEQLLTYVVFVGWSFYALAAATIFIYRKREILQSQRYRVPGYPWTPLLFIATVAVFVLNTIVAQPLRAAIGIGVVLTGIPGYLIWRKG